MRDCSITTDNNLARGLVRRRPKINEFCLTRTIVFLCLILILNFLLLEAICRQCRQHITEPVAQPEMIPDPYQQQPTSPVELKVSPDLPIQEQLSVYISHTGMQNVKQPFNTVII